MCLSLPPLDLRGRGPAVDAKRCAARWNVWLQTQLLQSVLHEFADQT